MATDAILEIQAPPVYDTLVPDPQVQKEFGVTAMSLWRWDRDPELIELGWPLPIRIRSRKFRSRIALESFKRTMARRAIEQRAQPSAQNQIICGASARANDFPKSVISPDAGSVPMRRRRAR